MKVALRDIPEEGLDVSQEVTAEVLGLADESFACLTPIAIDVHFSKADNVLLADVTAVGSYELTCARCLEPIRQERDDRFELTFDITPDLEFIEYGDDLRQELFLALCAIIRCREDCRGLCKTCGINLNKASCRCPQPGEEGRGINIQLKPKSKSK